MNNVAFRVEGLSIVHGEILSVLGEIFCFMWDRSLIKTIHFM